MAVLSEASLALLIGYLVFMAIAVGLSLKNKGLGLMAVGAMVVIGYFLSIPYFDKGAVILFGIIAMFVIAYKLILEGD